MCKRPEPLFFIPFPCARSFRFSTVVNAVKNALYRPLMSSLIVTCRTSPKSCEIVTGRRCTKGKLHGFRHFHCEDFPLRKDFPFTLRVIEGRFLFSLVLTWSNSLFFRSLSFFQIFLSSLVSDLFFYYSFYSIIVASFLQIWFVICRDKKRGKS